MEAAHRTSLAKGEVGIREKKAPPTLADFGNTFLNAVGSALDKRSTVEFYGRRLKRILLVEGMAKSRLDSIDESAIQRYIQERQASTECPAVATLNRELATLRRVLRLAQEWKLIEGVPRIRLLRGERVRDFVLAYKNEAAYLGACPEPLRSIAIVLLDTGMRLGEVLALDWQNVHFEPAPGARLGYIHISRGKTKAAIRNISMTQRVRAVLTFPGDGAGLVFKSPKTRAALLPTSLGHTHQRVRRALGLPEDFVLHSLRHTFLTRYGAAGASAFDIMRVAGHASIAVSARYVHPTPETLERSFDRLELYNQEHSTAGMLQ